MKKFKKIFSAALLFCMIGALIPSVQANAATSQQQAIVNEARKHLGKPYVYGATGPNTFDCSGLTQYVYRQALGIEIGRTTWDQIKSGTEVLQSDLQPGDLVFPKSDLGHVQIYTGNGMVLHAPQTGDVVKEVPMYGFFRARRIVSGNIEKPNNKNGWTYEDGKSYYYNNGVKQKGWIYVNNHSYYLDLNDGHMLTGWQESSGRWYYLNTTYGHMEKGWLEVNGNRYYLDPTYGHMWTGWNEVGGNKYYFNTTYGHAEKGWLQLGYKWYYMNENDGYMEKGWIYANGNSYYLDLNDGHMLTGLLEVNGNKYYLDTTYGHMLTGWLKIGGNWYYMNKTYGHAEINTIVDGYTLNADGIAIDKFD
ncbi:NlpC/P60 family protein [Clostridium paraputrificum]|uniref:C40 family peptidase n=1 Tax=Clostridium paraputrificum TaxID=29363 RepID=UPI003D332F7A